MFPQFSRSTRGTDRIKIQNTDRLIRTIKPKISSKPDFITAQEIPQPSRVDFTMPLPTLRKTSKKLMIDTNHRIRSLPIITGEQPLYKESTQGRARTGMALLPLVFETNASTYSATWALRSRVDLNHRKRFCRPLPRLSATRPCIRKSTYSPTALSGLRRLQILPTVWLHY